MTTTLTSTAYKGVRWNSQVDKWVAYVTVNRKEQSLGRFTDLTDAIQARIAGELIYYGVIKTTPPTSLQGFKDILDTHETPFYYATASLRTPPRNTDNVRWQKDHWVAFTTAGDELTVLGKFRSYEDAYDFVKLSERQWN